MTPPHASDNPAPGEQETVLQAGAIVPWQGRISRNAFQVGMRLGEFEILDVIGEGGFGIVYLAQDHALQRRVALKEYFPHTMAYRAAGQRVEPLSQDETEIFDIGMRSFIKEARTLAEFDHPSLIKVFRFWEANGTAYMVMPYYEGKTLRQTLLAGDKRPDEAWMKNLLGSLLDALSILHAAHCLHRDIAPDNILMLADGRPLLLDFGAARKVTAQKTGDQAQAQLTVLLKPGYAPLEQYGDSNQGPWTDIYALACVAYFAITGISPRPSPDRLQSDSVQPLEQAAAGLYSPAFLKAIDGAMSMHAADRPQNVDAMRKALQLDSPATRQDTAFKHWAAVAALAAIAVLAVALVWKQPQSTGEIARGTGEAGPVVPRPFDPIDALDEVFEARDRDHAVSVSVDPAQVRIGRDKLHFEVRSSKPGYVYVLMVGTDRAHMYMLFPNQLDRNNRIEAGRPLALPRSSWQMTAGGPEGADHFVAIVSETPRDFSAAGLQATPPFAEFPLDALKARYQAHQGPLPLLAGEAACTDAQECVRNYGASVFAIEEIN